MTSTILTVVAGVLLSFLLTKKGYKHRYNTKRKTKQKFKHYV